MRAEAQSTAGAGRRALLALAVLWLATLLVTPLVGSTPVSLAEVVAGDDTAATIFWQLRLPRVLLAIVAGGVLAISGVAFQTLFGNPLTEPYTLGLSSGAALGAVVAIQLLGGSSGAGFLGVAGASFLGAIGVALLVTGIAGSRLGRDSNTVLLAGIALSLTCSAFILLLQYLADFTKTFRMVRWMMGGLSVVGFGDVLWVSPWLVIGGGFLLAQRWELNLLLAGQELAASRGVDLRRLRVTVLVTVSAMVGALVAVTGPIGFVGLIVPHALRPWVGSDHRQLLPAALLAGGAFLALCDAAARTILAPAELPVGILTALLGGPFFLLLLLRRSPR